MSLSERTRTGLREMPSNAAWLLSRVLKPADAVGTATDSARSAARDQRRKVTAAVVDAAPINRDSVDIRLKRVVNSQVFRFEQTEETMLVKNFSEIRPGKDIAG